MEEIIYKSLDEVLHDSMIPYTEHVVLDRALPRVEDGLKPVQRRILYSMLELGLQPEKPYRKSARIVGDCMGKYHPHGDSSVYDAMVRMSQDFVLRAPLVDGHGNFGSVDGDSAAAMRYTEARLAPLAMELLRDLEKDTVKWSLNFDDTLKEPDMLPGRFPNLLVNGASGIAVGVATNIPPHNLGEVIDGVVAYIDNPKITLDEMMNIIKGPDFPTGGELIYGEGLKDAYSTGKGKITIRAKVGIEGTGDKQNLVITELPYQVNKAALLQKIVELKDANKDKLSVISEIRDESDKNGMRAVIKLKKEANPKKILEMLFKSTNMQISYAINMVAIAGGKPRLMPLMDIISYYTNYQREVIIRRTKFDLNAAKERAHIVEGLLKAIANIDAVIKIIKSSPTIAEAKTRLKAKFGFSEKQTQAILDMRLARLVNLEEDKLKAELKELNETIDRLTKILGSKTLQNGVVKKEILEIKKAFATPRKSHVLKNADIKVKEVETEVVSVQNYMLAITAGGTVKKVTAKNYSMSNKALSDNSALTDVHSQVLSCTSADTILIFSDTGNVIKVPVDKLKECKWRDKGFAMNEIDKAASTKETAIAALVAGKGTDVLFFTKAGMVKRSTLADTLTQKSYYQAVKIAEGDLLIGVEYLDSKKKILMLSANGMSLAFDAADVPSQGRVSGGVKGINLDDGDSVVFAGQFAENEEVIAASSNGYLKKIPCSAFALSSRYRKGLKYFALTGKAVVCFAMLASSSTTLAVDFGLKILPLETKKFKQFDRLSEGELIIKRKALGIYKFC